jgi:hypothetical protein
VVLQARLHLEMVFDETDFDVACALMPFTYFSQLYSDSPLTGAPSSSPTLHSRIPSSHILAPHTCHEGLKSGQYYATLGVNMCQQLGACNDPVYLSLVAYGKAKACMDGRRLVLS